MRNLFPKITAIISASFLFTGIGFEYAAIWANQWALKDATAQLSNLLQATAGLNIIIAGLTFVVAMLFWVSAKEDPTV